MLGVVCLSACAAVFMMCVTTDVSGMCRVCLCAPADMANMYVCMCVRTCGVVHLYMCVAILVCKHKGMCTVNMNTCVSRCAGEWVRMCHNACEGVFGVI